MHFQKLTQNKLLRFLEEEILGLKNSKETKTNNSSWMLRPRQSDLLLTNKSPGTFKMLVVQQTCKFGRPMEDGSKCSSTLETLLEMKEENTSVFKINKILLFNNHSQILGPNGQSDMKRILHIRQVNTTNNSVCIVTDTSTSFQRKMEDT